MKYDHCSTNGSGNHFCFDFGGLHQPVVGRHSFRARVEIFFTIRVVSPFFDLCDVDGDDLGINRVICHSDTFIDAIAVSRVVAYIIYACYFLRSKINQCIKHAQIIYQSAMVRVFMNTELARVRMYRPH